MERNDDTRRRQQQPRRRQGGVRTVPFILATEVCDKFAGAGFHANMISYLTQQLHMPMVQASNTLTNFGGTSNFTTVVGGLVADSFAGRFWTITVGSLIYCLAMLFLTITAAIPIFRPPPCDPKSQTCQQSSGWQLSVLYSSLLLAAIGTGGLRPCVMAFGADQFDLRPGAKQKWSFFNIYYFTMGAALLLALTVVVYIQDNVSWAWGLGIPTMAMGFSIFTFVLGYPLYVKMKPGGSPLTRMAQVVVAAVRKRGVAMPSDPNLLHDDSKLDAGISTAGRLLHTNQLRFLDRAAIVTEDDRTSGECNLWRLSTVHRVEELKSLLRMLPIWFVGVISVMATSHNYSFVIMQARTMDRRLSPSFQIPPASMSIFSILAMLLTLAVYDRAIVPLARRLTSDPRGISYLLRMGIGYAIGTLATATSALIESKRKAVAARHGLLDHPGETVPLSVFWLVPQYAIHGLAEAFGSVGHLEFLYDQAPESMRSTAVALSWLAAAFGNYLGTLLVVLVRDCTRRRGEWLQDNINRGRLECYYLLVCAIQVVLLLYYVVCARLYTPKPLEVSGGREEDGAAVNGGGEVKLVRV